MNIILKRSRISYEGEKEHVCPIASSSSMKKPLLKELILSLQVTLVEADMVNVGIDEGINEEEVRKGNFDALSDLIGAKRDFDVYFPSRAAWENL
ncbi:hypothetical protein J1N35_040384 [Gossypium stocksii]|uniref:Uncharacterized protein n=1 Tax=Gossypium stocksii TaxID=47602 RepID=A0A9D3UDQ0_9ROSI|nr:hypothetical protein J1N35_040384 [Gossypium stocksii]